MSERLRLLTATLIVGSMAAGLWYSMTAAREQGGEIEAAAEAVRAWGSFAASGDIAAVAGWFASDGPQFAQLLAEVGSIVPGGDYDFELSGAELIGPGLVRGVITLGSAGAVEQEFQWDIELVQENGNWKVWTVRTTP